MNASEWTQLCLDIQRDSVSRRGLVTALHSREIERVWTGAEGGREGEERGREGGREYKK